MKFSTPEGTKKVFVVAILAAIAYSALGPVGLGAVALYFLLKD